MTVYMNLGKSDAAENGAMPMPMRIDRAQLLRKAYGDEDVLALALSGKASQTPVSASYGLIGSDTYEGFLNDFGVDTSRIGELEKRVVAVFVRKGSPDMIVGLTPMDL